MPPTPTPTPRSRIGTRASNKSAHPGFADKGKIRRTHSEVQRERISKAQAKAAREEAKEKNIARLAEFELADEVDENLDNATPRRNPLCTPRVTRDQARLDLTPLTALPMDENSETSDTSETESFVEPPFEEDSEDDLGKSAVESSEPTPVKRRSTVKKVAAKTGNVNESGSHVHSEVVPLYFWWRCLMLSCFRCPRE